MKIRAGAIRPWRWAALLVAVPALLLLASRPAQAQTLPIADGQLFSVRLTTTQPAAGATGGLVPACDAPTRSQIEGLTFQFAFQRQQDLLSVAITVSGSMLPGTTAAIAGASPALTNVSVDAAPGLTLTFSSPIATTAGSNGRAAAIALTAITGDARLIGGDVVFDCVFAATGKGVPDTTPPQAQFALYCHDAAGRPAPCLLLPEGMVTLTFSKPVVLAGAAALLSAADQGGQPVALLPDLTGNAVDTALPVYGYWPLGGQVTLTLAPGVSDTAGNSDGVAVSQTFSVVADPGMPPDLGFESGTLAGYTVQTLPDYREALFDQALYLAQNDLPPSLAAQVVSSYRGIVPSEGQFMAAIDNGENCQVGEVALVTRLTVPADATVLLLDDALVLRGGHAGEAHTIVTATIRTAGEFRTVTQPSPDPAAMQPLDAESEAGGWQQLAVPVDDLAGQQVVLTLRLRPSTVLAPPPLCIQGTLLLDNLRFE